MSPAITLAAAVLGGAAPEQLHLSWASVEGAPYPNSMVVAWYTEDKTPTSTVQFGAGLEAAGEAAQYLEGYGWHHRVTLPALLPSTRYPYRVGDAAGGWSPFKAFVSAPNSTSADFSVSIFGDMGWLGSDERPMAITTDGLQKHWSAVPTRQRLEALRLAGDFDYVWIVGDIGYADDAFAHRHSLLRLSYETAYNGFVNWLANISETMPVMVSPGNHESECHGACMIDAKQGHALQNFTAYNTRWHMPWRSSGGVANMWYSYNMGAAHFISMNSETDFPGAGEHDKGDSGDSKFPAGHFAPEGAYLRWLEADLAAAHAARAERPWIIAGGHRPFHEVAGNGVQALFDKYGVDAYFAGHSHSYARSALGSTALVVVGGAGCDEMPLVKGPLTHAQSAALGAVPLDGPAPAYATSRLASGTLRVTRDQLVWTLHDSITGAKLDSWNKTSAA